MTTTVGYKLYLLPSWRLRGWISRPVGERKETDWGFCFEFLRLDLWHHQINSNTQQKFSSPPPAGGRAAGVLEIRKIRYSLNDVVQLSNEMVTVSSLPASSSPRIINLASLWVHVSNLCICTWPMPVQLPQCVLDTPDSPRVRSRRLKCLLWCLCLWTPGMHQTLLWYGVDFCMVGGRLSGISRCSSC